MSWVIFQTRRFSRQYKKLHDNTAADVDSAVDEVRKNPEIGERKKGDLAALRVFKFHSKGQLYYWVTHSMKVLDSSIWKPSGRMKISIEI
jgi:hypothetical protein